MLFDQHRVVVIGSDSGVELCQQLACHQPPQRGHLVQEYPRVGPRRIIEHAGVNNRKACPAHRVVEWPGTGNGLDNTRSEKG